MADETRTFEELKAEQDRLWAESESKPEPEGYDAWFRAQVQEALDECAKPDAVFYTQEQVEEETAAQIRSWRARERKTA